MLRLCDYNKKAAEIAVREGEKLPLNRVGFDARQCAAASVRPVVANRVRDGDFREVIRRSSWESAASPPTSFQRSTVDTALRNCDTVTCTPCSAQSYTTIELCVIAALLSDLSLIHIS